MSRSTQRNEIIRAYYKYPYNDLVKWRLTEEEVNRGVSIKNMWYSREPLFNTSVSNEGPVMYLFKGYMYYFNTDHDSSGNLYTQLDNNEEGCAFYMPIITINGIEYILDFGLIPVFNESDMSTCIGYFDRSHNSYITKSGNSNNKIKPKFNCIYTDEKGKDKDHYTYAYAKNAFGLFHNESDDSKDVINWLEKSYDIEFYNEQNKLIKGTTNATTKGFSKVSNSDYLFNRRSMNVLRPEITVSNSGTEITLYRVFNHVSHPGRDGVSDSEFIKQIIGPRRCADNESLDTYVRDYRYCYHYRSIYNQYTNTDGHVFDYYSYDHKVTIYGDSSAYMCDGNNNLIGKINNSDSNKNYIVLEPNTNNKYTNNKYNSSDISNKFNTLSDSFDPNNCLLYSLGSSKFYSMNSSGKISDNPIDFSKGSANTISMMYVDNNNDIKTMYGHPNTIRIGTSSYNSEYEVIAFGGNGESVKHHYNPLTSKHFN